MDFVTAHSRTYRVRINGTAYDVPRFLLPEFETWASGRNQADIDRALERIPEREKQAQFLLYYRPPPLDVAILADEARTPSGIKFVVNNCLERAGVPRDVRDALLINGDPMALRRLAEELLSAAEGAETLKEESGDPGGERGADPLTSPPPASGGGQETGQSSGDASTPATTPTQAA